MMTRSKRKLEARQSLAAKPSRQIKLKQQIPRGHVSSSGSSNRPCQLRRYCQVRGCQENMACQGSSLEILDCPTSMEDYSAMDGEASSGAGSLALLVKAACHKKPQEQQGQTKWTKAEIQSLFTFVDSPDKIQKYFINKTKFSSQTAKAMSVHLGYYVDGKRVQRKLTQVADRLHVSTPDEASVSIFIAGLCSTLCNAASSSQSQSKKPRSSKSESVQLSSSKSKILVSSVSEALSYVSEHVPITNDQRIKYSRAMLQEPDVYLEVFNSHSTVEEKKSFLDHISGP